DAGRQYEFVGGTVTHAQVDQAGGFFLHVDIDVDLVGRARNRRGVHIDVVEVAQAIDAVARRLDVAGVVPGGFLLAHFAPDDFVAGAGVAADLDPAHIDSAARIDIKGKVGFVRVAIEHGVGIDVGKRVAQGTQVIGNGLDRGVGLGSREGFAFFDFDQGLDFVVQTEQVAGQLDAAHVVGLAFVQGKRDEDILTVGRDRNLRR